jgi:hypothetical protein
MLWATVIVFQESVLYDWRVAQLTDHDPGTPVAVVGVGANGQQSDELRSEKNAGNVKEEGVYWNLVSQTVIEGTVEEKRWERLAIQVLSAPMDDAVRKGLSSKSLSQSATITTNC